MNITDLLAYSEYHDEFKTDFSGEEWNFHINDDMDIQAVNKHTAVSVTPLHLTDYALTQMVQRVGTLTPVVAHALRANEATRPHAARILEELRQQQQERQRTREWLVRGYDKTARAILTTQYANTPNTSLLRLVLEAVEEQARGAGQAVDINHFPADRSSVTPDDVFLYVGLNSVNVPGAGGFKIGFSVRNSEIGNSALYVRPYVQRTSCLNSILFDAEEFYSVHRGSNTMLMSNFAIAVGNALKLSMDGLTRLMKSREIPVNNIQDEITTLASNYGWSTDFVASVGVGTEGNETVYGLVNGITYAAHQHYTDHETMMKTELLGGRILMERTANGVL